MNSNIAELYDFSLRQMVAEAYLDNSLLLDPTAVKEAVRRGNNWS